MLLELRPNGSRIETGDWRLETGEWGMGNEKWRMENGEWRMKNEKWRMENGEWRMENGDLHDRASLSTGFIPVGATTGSYTNRLIIKLARIAKAAGNSQRNQRQNRKECSCKQRPLRSIPLPNQPRQQTR